MPAPRRRLLPIAVTVAAASAALVPASVSAQSGGSSPTPSKPSSGSSNARGVCKPSHAPPLRCPNLTLRSPFDRFYERVGGRLLYRAGNSIVNRGAGPAEIFGYRTGAGPMNVAQHIYGADGRRYSFASPGAHIVFKLIPGQGGYWKFENAARFELWSVDSSGKLDKMVRTGPKLVYCLRDLTKRVFTLPFSPPARHYPACNQDPSRRSVTLGTSVGWADEYPSPYYEQYIDVTGLRGRFVLQQRVDPFDAIRESNEDDNVSPKVTLQLPPPASSVRTSAGGGGY